MAGDSGMAGKVALLLWAQTLGLAGAQTTQLLVYPPWTPAVLWDTVTLTCQGSGTSGATTWHKDGQRWGMEGRDQFIVTESGTYRCHRPGTGFSDTVSVSNDPLVLQVSARALLEGDTVTLRCRLRSDTSFAAVSLYRAKGTSELLHEGTELSLSPLQLNHSGHYGCRGHFDFATSQGTWSQPVTVTVRELFSVPLLEGPPEVIVGSSLNLSCLSTPSPLRPPAPSCTSSTGTGSWWGARRGPRSCWCPPWGCPTRAITAARCAPRGGRAEEQRPAPRHVPVANVTITPGPPAHQVRPGDPVTLRCSVQVGSAPVTFTWLRDGQEVARGAVLELGDTDVGHSGTYQCVATIELDGHPEFRALSPELALEVTLRGPWGTAVAVNVGRTLLYLLLLVAVIGGCHCWHRMGARKAQDRAPPEPPEEGEVLDTLIEGIERAGGSPGVSPGAAPPRDPQVTKAELSGPCEGQQDPGDSYENVP